MAEDYLVPPEVKWARFLQYVDLSVREQIRGMAEYSAGNFRGYEEENFYEALKEDFARWDWDSLQTSEAYLRAPMCCGLISQRMREWLYMYKEVLV